jgi:pilus assembly protein CpaC
VITPRTRLQRTLAVLAVLALAVVGAYAQASEEIRITAGKSVVLDYPEDVARISTSNPEIVDYVPVSTREILLHAKGQGMATLVVWAKSGQRNFYNINVEPNLEPLRKLIKETFPGEQIQVVGAKDSISLIGVVSTPGVAERLVALVTPAAKTVVNNMKVRAAPIEKQIILRVKFAELNRTASDQFAVNLVSTGAGNIIGATGTGQFSSARPSNIGGGQNSFSITDALNIFAFAPSLDLAAFIKLLNSQGLLQILAEPNLVTTNGKEASFLVGGEFPVPVLQGGANSGAVTVQFREFGIRLTFTPTLTENGTLKMYVKPEVSSIDLANAVSVSGFVIPALATRRIESNIELGVGQTFVIGGLIDDRTTETFNRIPGLASIPLLGELFKSRNQNHSKTELVVMVTPEIVEPMSPDDPRLKVNTMGGQMRPYMFSNGIPENSPGMKVKPTPLAPKLPPATDQKEAYTIVKPNGSKK